jgi:hypothetical protein
MLRLRPELSLYIEPRGVEHWQANMLDGFRGHEHSSTLVLPSAIAMVNSTSNMIGEAIS